MVNPKNKFDNASKRTTRRLPKHRSVIDSYFQPNDKDRPFPKPGPKTRISPAELRELLIAHVVHGRTGGNEGKFGYFVDMDLTDADFRNADLRFAIFQNCIMDGADFTGAKLKGTRFSSIDFRKTKGMDTRWVRKIASFGTCPLPPLRRRKRPVSTADL